jgi:hypothetical protein
MKHIAEQFPLPVLLPATLPPVSIAPVEVSAPAKIHHKFGPSRMGYLDTCAGFTSRSGTNDAAEEGTALHERIEAIIQLARRQETSACQALVSYATQHDLADDERDWLRFCCVRCDVYLARKPLQVLTEISVNVTAENGTELNHGTLDVVFVWKDVAIIIDFKFGYVPVKHATKNLQGMNYGLGVFQKFHTLRAVGVEFVQPKLNWFSTTSYQRAQMAEMFQRLSEVIERAIFVQTNPEDAQKFMQPGLYCQYCSLSGSCAVLSNHRALAATRFNDLPQPASFKGLSINTPQEIALARYWVDVIESGVKEIKQRAFELAELNGGEISCVLPGGEEVTYCIAEKNADRSLGSPIEISEALKEFLTPAEILGAAELALGKLEPIAKNALVEAAKQRGEKLTKKAAWESVVSTLEANGLLTRPDGKIRFLKRKKQAPIEPKQIEQQTKE